MLALIILIVMLVLLICVHEAGHFITAKKCGAHVYEFSLGMGPKIFGWKRKGDPTDYSIRAFPIGGYCAIAGEVDENDGFDVKLKKNQYMCNKKPWQRFVILVAGVTMNFITGLVLLFLSALIFGSNDPSPVVGQLQKNYPMSKAGVEVGDKILVINDKKVDSWDMITLRLVQKNEKDFYTFKVEKTTGEIKTYTVYPKYKKDKDGNKTPKFGFGQKAEKQTGVLGSIKYAFVKTKIIINSMAVIVGNLFTGGISLKNLSGPVGVYQVVDTAKQSSAAIESLIYLTAYLSLNLGFMNLLPFPAVDGGRILFLFIEVIRKKKMNPKVEGYVNAVGFALLMLLMLIITVKDILNLF